MLNAGLTAPYMFRAGDMFRGRGLRRSRTVMSSLPGPDEVYIAVNTTHVSPMFFGE